MKYREFYKEVLLAALKNSTCTRVQVSALIVNDGRILSTGWNGSLPGMQHCSTYFSEEDRLQDDFYDKHREFSEKNESHAEMSAIAFAAKNGIAIGGCDIIVSTSPCLPCAKMIAMAGLKDVYYLTKYDRDPEGIVLLNRRTNGICTQL
jgi:dCMP deaminase